MKRTNLVVPEDLMATLRVPSLAVTNGDADPEWVEVPMSQWLFKRQPSMRLPLDSVSAKKTRRYVRLAPWSLLVTFVAAVAWSASVFWDLSGPRSLVAILVAAGLPVAWSVLGPRGLPRQVPFRTRFGDLCIPNVPVEVAEEWVAHNEGVTATHEPAPRPHSRRFYAVWSGCLLLAAIGLVLVLANNQREDHVLLWMLVPALFFTGVAMAFKTQPPAQVGTGPTWLS
jgi:hypothetical protein